MIESHELMIGNYFQTKNLDEYPDIYEVKSVNHNLIDFTYPGRDEVGEIALKLLEPITLNEQWLLSFGFEKNLYFDGGFGINISGGDTFYLRPSYMDGWYFGWIDGDNDNDYELSDCRVMYHVHDLQNTFYCLTGQKLQRND